jgi:hypothetical protein
MVGGHVWLPPRFARHDSRRLENSDHSGAGAHRRVSETPPRAAGLEGWAAPAAASHSPVARDYPSRALSDVFQAAAPNLYRSVWLLTSSGCHHPWSQNK